MDSDTTTATYFNIFVTGQIESVTFPLGPEASEIFCRYEAVAGRDWQLMSGIKNGITQSASNLNGNFNDPITFNMPIELTYRTTNPFGWPQLLICIYGKKRWNIETSLGYARVHIPVLGFEGEEQMLKAPIIKPRSSNAMSELSSWLTGRNVELKNPKVLLDGTQTHGLSTESYGDIQLRLHAISRGTAPLDLEY